MNLRVDGQEADDQHSLSTSKDDVERLEPCPPELILTPVSRRPLNLPQQTVQVVIERPIPVFPMPAHNSSAAGKNKRVSIVVITFNNLVFTRLCLESVLANTHYPDYEIIVVDNNSIDGTPSYLQELERLYPHVHVILNEYNRGFAPANNQGLALATGHILVLLNNDTLVPSGWLNRLVQYLEEDASIGLLGPVTNRIGNEAEIEVSYATYGEFVQFAHDYTRQHPGQTFEIHTLCMYCLAMRRDVYGHLGPLDERYEVGMLEDDDYSMRAHAAGYRVICAEDVFVHHFGGASFGNLVPTGEYGSLIEANRRRFEEKWGVQWEPYGRRLSEGYKQLPQRIRESIHDVIPVDATVLVVSKGDDELLRLNGQRAWHFPRNEDGTYAGYYPGDSTEAIAHLEELRGEGATYLIFPGSTLWWLEHYQDFRQHLDSHFQRVYADESCVIYQIQG
jgi:GT2 family glycosyltransferase